VNEQQCAVMDIRNRNYGESGYINAYIAAGEGRTVYVNVEGNGTHISIDDAQRLVDTLEAAIWEAQSHAD
jgi:hypothetical protein